MDPGMLQPDGRVIFPIRLPKKKTNANNTNQTDNTKDKTAIFDKDSNAGKMLQKLTSRFSFSVIRSAVVPIGLALAAVFAKEAISVFRGFKR